MVVDDDEDCELNHACWMVVAQVWRAAGKGEDDWRENAHFGGAGGRI